LFDIVGFIIAIVAIVCCCCCCISIRYCWRCCWWCYDFI